MVLKLFALVLFIGLSACTSTTKKSQTNSSDSLDNSVKTGINSEAQALLNTLNEMGDYANSRDFPSLIKASTVFDELDSNILVIDLRSEEAFSSGHIRNAVNLEFTALPGYFSNNIDPATYAKIVLTCYAGQIASYATSLLRLAGYNNVYAMRWGMSSWNKHFAEDAWLEVLSSDYQEGLETSDNEKHQVVDFPDLNTGNSSGDEILKQRIDSLFKTGFRDAIVYAEDVFEDPQAYYIINYDRKDKYEAGHIPGAVRYKPGAMLGIISEMQTIPSDKTVIVYCNTGQNSGFATAYLRLFAYPAKSLAYGANSFMYKQMQDQKENLSWILFSDEEIHDYPYVKN